MNTQNDENKVVADLAEGDWVRSDRDPDEGINLRAAGASLRRKLAEAREGKRNPRAPR